MKLLFCSKTEYKTSPTRCFEHHLLSTPHQQLQWIRFGLAWPGVFVILSERVVAPSISKYLQLYYNGMHTHTNIRAYISILTRYEYQSSTTTSIWRVQKCVSHRYILTHTYTHKNSKYFRNLPEKCAEECAANMTSFFSILFFFFSCTRSAPNHSIGALLSSLSVRESQL